MTRLEENQMVIGEMAERTERKPTGTYEELVVFQLGTIATMLADISKSLAILADKSEREDYGTPKETVTEFADRCRGCGANTGRSLATLAKIKDIVSEWEKDTWTDGLSYECMIQISNLLKESEG